MPLRLTNSTKHKSTSDSGKAPKKTKHGSEEHGSEMTWQGVGEDIETTLGLSTSPSVDHLYSNLWVWSTCGVITWIQTGLSAGSPGPQMITHRLPVCIYTCPKLHDSPTLHQEVTRVSQKLARASWTPEVVACPCGTAVACPCTMAVAVSAVSVFGTQRGQEDV